MPEWAIRLVCSVAGGIIGVIVMACCAMARDADGVGKADKPTIRVLWKCPNCGLERGGQFSVRNQTTRGE